MAPLNMTITNCIPASNQTSMQRSDGRSANEGIIISLLQLLLASVTVAVPVAIFYARRYYKHCQARSGEPSYTLDGAHLEHGLSSNGE